MRTYESPMDSVHQPASVTAVSDSMMQFDDYPSQTLPLDGAPVKQKCHALARRTLGLL